MALSWTMERSRGIQGDKRERSNESKKRGAKRMLVIVQGKVFIYLREFNLSRQLRAYFRRNRTCGVVFVRE